MSDNKPLIVLAGTVVVLLALGYALIRLPVSGVQLVDPTVAIGVVAVLFVLSGVWVFRAAKSA